MNVRGINMKVKNRSISLVLLLTIGVITIVSFSLGCTEQEENVSTPVANMSQQPEPAVNTSQQLESLDNVSNQSESVENVSSKVVSSDDSSSKVVSSGSSSGSGSSKDSSSESVSSDDSSSSSSSDDSSSSSSSDDSSSESASSDESSSESTLSDDSSQQIEPVSADSIVGIKWLWAGYKHAGENVQVPNPDQYTLSLFPDDTYYLKTDCNSGSGSYVLEGTNLTLNTATMTLVACGPDSMDPEYTALITGVKSVTIKDGQLVLYSSEGDTMFFNNGGQAEQ
jgi:heat shock protein HslJ